MLGTVLGKCIMTMAIAIAAVTITITTMITIMTMTIVMAKRCLRINGCHTLMNQGYLMNMA